MQNDVLSLMCVPVVAAKVGVAAVVRTVLAQLVKQGFVRDTVCVHLYTAWPSFYCWHAGENSNVGWNAPVA